MHIELALVAVVVIMAIAGSALVFSTESQHWQKTKIARK